MEPRIPDPLSAAQNPDGWFVIARCLSGFRRLRGHACVRLCVCTLYTLTYDNDTFTDGTDANRSKLLVVSEKELLWNGDLQSK